MNAIVPSHDPFRFVNFDAQNVNDRRLYMINNKEYTTITKELLKLSQRLDQTIKKAKISSVQISIRHKCW